MGGGWNMLHFAELPVEHEFGIAFGLDVPWEDACIFIKTCLECVQSVKFALTLLKIGIQMATIIGAWYVFDTSSSNRLFMNIFRLYGPASCGQ